MTCTWHISNYSASLGIANRHHHHHHLSSEDKDSIFSAAKAASALMSSNVDHDILVLSVQVFDNLPTSSRSAIFYTRVSRTAYQENDTAKILPARSLGISSCSEYTSSDLSLSSKIHTGVLLCLDRVCEVLRSSGT